MAAIARSGVALSAFLTLAITEIAFPVLALIAGLIAGWFAYVILTGNSLRRAKMDADQIRATARTEADASKQKIELEAEKRARERREELDREIAEARADIKKDQQRLAKREDTLDQKLESISERESRMDRKETDLRSLEESLTKDREQIEKDQQQIKARLQELSGMTPDQAREQFMEEIRRESEHEGNRLSQKIIEEAETEARRRSREITLNAIQRYASEHVADSTVRSVRIPSDDLKGRIIGREGRNIRALERATGVDILVDDTPGVIAVSCFDPIRRAIAGEALSKLVADGRVHPSRIEEIVETVRKDMVERIQKHGQDSVMESNIRGLHPKIVEAMGKLHFRTSYGQNVLRHSMEVAYLSQIIADQLGLKGDIARRCGFLHDIGKAMDHEMEGGHPAIGMEFARKYGEKSEEVLNAIGGHHGDIPATTPYTPIVMAADAISGARPGARRESMEMYIKRLEQLEGIATQYGNVTEAHAIQAGREVRVIVDAKKADDAEAFSIAKKIAKQVEDEMTFPGEIKVTVLREVRAEATAR
ncbi:MAG: ribonuclease Y [Phycisphaerales bacterium]|nr:MAG: ribonuclease Y [Phycisphaerales bacterium]